VRQVVPFAPADTLPAADAVLRAFDLDGGDGPSPRARRALDDALRIYSEAAEPRALLETVDEEELAGIHRAAGTMPDGSVVGRLLPRAQARALFVATVGEPVCARIRELFRRDEVALAYLLDLVASVAADRLADRTAARFQQGLPGMAVLPYSPGYCGWPLRGQIALFDRLRPGEIEVALNDSCLMTPLKSVSGVLLAAPPAAHDFDDDFPFCSECATHECRTRLRALASQ